MPHEDATVVIQVWDGSLDHYAEGRADHTCWGGERSDGVRVNIAQSVRGGMGGYEAGGKRKHIIDRESACAKAQIQPHFVRLRSCYLYFCNVFPPSLSSTSLALGPAVWEAPTWEGRTPRLGPKKLPPLVEAVFMCCDTHRMLGDQEKKCPGWGDWEQEEETIFLRFRWNKGRDSIFYPNFHVITSEHGWG